MRRLEHLTPEAHAAIARSERAYQEQMAEFHQVEPDHQSWWLQTLRSHYRPNIEGLPDYGLANLNPNSEKYCRALCERHGVSYERVRDNFVASSQVIQSRRPNPISDHLRGNGLIPLNVLDEAYVSYCQGAVLMALELKSQRGQQAIKAMISVE